MGHVNIGIGWKKGGKVMRRGGNLRAPIDRWHSYAKGGAAKKTNITAKHKPKSVQTTHMKFRRGGSASRRRKRPRLPSGGGGGGSGKPWIGKPWWKK